MPTWPRLLMVFGLATSTGSLIVVGASTLAGITWWLGTQSESLSQTESANNLIAGLNPVWPEVVWGISMFFLSLLVFFIRVL